MYNDYNLINNFSIIACGARRERSCATAYLLTGAQDTLRTGIDRDDRELFHQIIVKSEKWEEYLNSKYKVSLLVLNKMFKHLQECTISVKKQQDYLSDL